ncbi:MAG: hypothetical protein AB9897_02270 [Anaerolineaceae bacterium]
MKTPPILTDSRPPRLIPTLANGFNTVANNIWLIILPVAIDLLLWLGPKLKLETLLLPRLSSLSNQLLQLEGPDLKATIEASQSLWTQFLGQFNLNFMARTFPVGIPSLMARELITESPFGKALQFQVPTFSDAFIFLAIFLILGFFLGSVYFNSLSRYAIKPAEKLNFKKLMFQYGQNLVMALILLTVILIISVPVLLLLSAFSLINGGIADFLLLITMFILLWLIIPLVFAPHGIFVINQKALPSMLLSIRMVRFFLPGTGTFVITAALISEGLNLVWTIPGATSWLTIVSIFGHAFIVTALLTASFIYYREGLRWMQDTIQHLSTPISNPADGGPLGTTRQ